jgi:hypothetical protein
MSCDRSPNNHQPTTNNQQPTTINQQPSTNNQQLSTINQQPSTNNHQPTTNTQQLTANNYYHGTTPFSSKNPPVGPSAGNVAKRTGAVAPCSTVRVPL